MDNSTIIYIVAIILYVLYTTFFRKKEPEQMEDGGEGPEKADTAPRKPVSFEDLLKEIRREQKERERDLDWAGQENEEEISSKEEAVTQPVEEQEKYQRPQYKTYEETQEAVKSFGTQPLVKLDDQIDLASTKKILGEVEDVAGEYTASNKYAILLKNPETVRDAIVVSEILRRKHF